MQNFSPLALKLREYFEDDREAYCKNAKFQTAPLWNKNFITDSQKPSSLALLKRDNKWIQSSLAGYMVGFNHI